MIETPNSAASPDNDSQRGYVPTARGGTKEYGSVDISGDSVAHLGDNNLYGPISVNQLTLLIKDQGPRGALGDDQSIRKLLEPPGRRLRAPPKSLAERLELVIGNGEKLAKLWLATSYHILDALYFREESFRQYAVKEAHSRTFGWVLEPSDNRLQASLLAWLRNGHGCYWINGKAGSGKSTLMKYISQHEDLHPSLQSWADERKLVLAEHYFWYAGTDLQKSHEGILRSLLRQILAQRPDTAPIMFPGLAHHIQQLDAGNVDVDSGSLSILPPELEKALDLLVKSIPEDMAVCLLIDGIDEYSGDLFEFCKLLNRLGKHPSIKILMSSRPIPACCHLFARYPSFRMQDLTHDDIEKYIDEELMDDPLLEEMNLMEPNFATEIKQALVEKASGVFLWIVLVVKDLLLGLGDYDDRAALEARIQRLPSDLENLYDHMFARLNKEHQKEGSILLQIIKRGLEVQSSGLSAIQLSFASSPEAMTLSIKPKAVLSPKQEAMRVKMIDGRLRSRCCGLVEVQYFQGRMEACSKPRIDFLHRTVVEYLNQYYIWEKITCVFLVPLDDLNTILLSSCVSILAAETDQVPKYKGHVHKTFENCLKYSKALKAAGILSYVEYLSSAERMSVERIVSLECSGIQQSKDRYLDELYEYSDLTFLDDKKKSSHIFRQAPRSYNSPDIYAMFYLAIAGLTEFMHHQLVSSIPTASAMTDVLLHLLATTCRDDQLLSDYCSSIELLLKHADPNHISNHIRAHTIHELYELGPILHDIYSRKSALDIWSFWLGMRQDLCVCDNASYSIGMQDLRVLLAFVNAGAELTSKSAEKTSALKSLRNNLERSRTKIESGTLEGKKSLNGILSAFDRASNT